MVAFRSPPPVFGVELQSSVIADCPDLLARLDLMVETDAAVVVTDFKTARSRWSAGDVNAAEGPLIVSHELVRQFADKPFRLQFAVITKTKQPGVEIHPVPADPLRIERKVVKLTRRSTRVVVDRRAELGVVKKRPPQS